MKIIQKIKDAFKPRMNKKGQIAGLSLIPSIVGALVIGFVFLSVGADVMQNINDGQTANSAAKNSTQAGLDALIEVGSFGTTMGLIAAATVVLTLLAVGLGSLVFNR